jgi:hypothetical protein
MTLKNKLPRNDKRVDENNVENSNLLEDRTFRINVKFTNVRLTEIYERFIFKKVSDEKHLYGAF